MGIGSLAGPVVAAAVILGESAIEGINDSKLLSPKTRERLAAQIEKTALSHAIAWASVEEIDEMNIYHAAKLAMKRAVSQLCLRPDFLLIDGRDQIQMEIDQLAIVKGDRRSVSIAAASIIAKVHRDRWMTELDSQYPGYHLAKHKGYASLEHRTCLTQLGPSNLHRKSFQWKPVY